MIVISPFAKNTPDNKPCAKNFPFWPTTVPLLRAEGFKTVQVGVAGEEDIGADEKKFGLLIPELVKLLKSAEFYLAVDNGIVHLCHFYGIKGIVIYSRSDPLVFGYETNVNLLKSRSYLRPNLEQFLWWRDIPIAPESFVSPAEVVKAAVDFRGKLKG